MLIVIVSSYGCYGFTSGESLPRLTKHVRFFHVLLIWAGAPPITLLVASAKSGQILQPHSATQFFWELTSFSKASKFIIFQIFETVPGNEEHLKTSLRLSKTMSLYTLVTGVEKM